MTETYDARDRSHFFHCDVKNCSRKFKTENELNEHVYNTHQWLDETWSKRDKI